ncbi:MAG: ABA4-like family protein [Pseudomonadota bacterium]
MNLEAAFSLFNLSALIGWILLIFGPRRYRIVFYIPQYIIPTFLSLAYAGLMFSHFFTVEGGYGSLSEVGALFSVNELLLAGWVHFLAFDLFIGAWIAERSDAIGIPRIMQAVFLLATFMFGPVGLALFLGTSLGFTKKMEQTHA